MLHHSLVRECCCGVKGCYNFDQVEGEGADEQIQGLEATRCETIGGAKRCCALFG